MKELIYNYLKTSFKKRFRTEELETYVYQTLGKHGGYSTFAEKIKQLEQEGIIRGIKSWKTNGKLPTLYNGYQFIEKQHELDKLVKKELMTQFHPSINVAYYLSHPVDYEQDEVYLHALNDFMKCNQFSSVEPISINERSFQIFADEKWLSSTHGQTFLQRIHLTISDLWCYQTYEPFFYYRRPSDQLEANVLIVENKDTFFSLKKLFQKGITVWDTVNFNMLIYGEGWKILQSFKFFYELDFSTYNMINFYYFGDLDRVGITIWHQLRNAEEVDLKPFTFFYNFLLDAWGDTPQKLRKAQNGDPEALVSFTGYFSDSHARRIKHLWDDGYYIPQEGLNYNYMEMLASK